MSQRQVAITRAVLRYIWFTLSLIAVMTQIGVSIKWYEPPPKRLFGRAFIIMCYGRPVGRMIAKEVLRYYELNASIEQLLKI